MDPISYLKNPLSQFHLNQQAGKLKANIFALNQVSKQFS